MGVLRRLGNLFRRERVEAEVEAELRAHLEMAAEDAMRAGMSEEEAQRAARVRFGNPQVMRERTAGEDAALWMEGLWRDVKFALRQMRKSPGFAATVVLTLALGIGAAAAMFTVVDHVLLQPVPYRDPLRLVMVQEGGGGASWHDIQQWKRQSHSFAQIAFWGGVTGGNQYIETKSAALEVSAQQITSNLFATLGVQPTLGRGFLPTRPSFVPNKNTGTVVLSNSVWQDAFGGQKNILGRVVRINKASYTVVGVMPPGFSFPAGTRRFGQIWFPVQLTKKDRKESWNATRWNVIARLRSHISLSQAEAEMAALQKRVVAGYSNPRMRRLYSRAEVRRYVSSLVGSHVGQALWALLGAAGLLWLIANLNVTNLLLARGTARRREIAMRGALGASRWRIVRQMLVEALLLSTSAGVLGIGLAVASVKLMSHELAAHLPLPVPAAPDLWVVGMLLALTIASALISAAWPTLLDVRAPVEPMLRQGSAQAGTGRRHHRARGALVATEIAMSLTLLVACGLLLRTLYALRHVPLGYRTDHIIVAQLSIPSYRYAGKNMTTTLYEPLLQRVKRLHGVEYAGLTTEVPLTHTVPIEVLLRTGGRKASTLFKASTAGLRKVYGLQMAAGRYFDRQDTSSSKPVIVVNQAFARAYSPNAHDPSTILGTKLMSTSLGNQHSASAEIVGVLDNERQNSPAESSQPEIDLCLCQITPNNMFYRQMEGVAMDLAIRTSRPTAEIIPELHDLLRQSDPDLANSTITTMNQLVEDSYGSQRLAAHLLELFGGVALLLCVAGLYGLLAYVVSQRARDLAVRIALGAERRDLIWMVLRQASVMLGAGIAAGCVLAWVSAAVIRGFLYGVQAHNGWILAGASLLLFAGGLLAAYLPARRAAGVDPMRVLRME